MTRHKLKKKKLLRILRTYKIKIGSRHSWLALNIRNCKTKSLYAGQTEADNSQKQSQSCRAYSVSKKKPLKSSR